MPFNKKLPEWFAQGIEPTTTQKTTGYIPGLKPPAQWFNWHLNTAYLAMQELQQNAVHKEIFESRFDTIDTKSITLNAGVQILNAVKAAPFSLSGVTGRMLVNLLGRMGNCESVGLWSSNTTIAVDTANKTSGTSSFKLTLGSVPATASATFLTTPGRKYIAISDVKNGNTSKVAISINGIAEAKGNEITSASAFAPSVVRFAATDFFHIVTITGTGASGNTFNMDSVRVYEVSDTDYAAAATLTPAQAAAKWPYVDSVMPVRNPYAIRYGENLLPPFYEWEVSGAATGKASINGPYSLNITTTTINNYVRYKTKVVPNTNYTWTVTHSGRIAVSDKNDANLIVPYTINQTGVFNSGANDEIYFYVSNDSVATGTFTFTNPMLNIGSTAKPFKPREDSMLALQTDLYADPVTGANADTVYERDGQYFKSKKWKGLVLDGNQPWTYFDTGTGYKVVRLVVTDGVTNSEIVTKYDGKLIPHAFPVSSADQSYLSASSTAFGLSVSIADSGWADGYQPSQDDIKAYFFGYKAYDANTITPAQAQAATTATWTGTGTKYWVQRVGAANFTQSVPQTSYAGYTPYQLVYQLTTPTVEPIISECQLAFTEGDNQVEVGTGIVLRERSGINTMPGVYAYVNAEFPLKYKPRNILDVYKNGKKDSRWEVIIRPGSDVFAPIGIAFARLVEGLYDPADSFSTTYLMTDTSPVVPFTGSYAANEKTLLADLVDGVQQANTRLSVVENKKADKDNPAWLAPTLVNGATNTSSSEQAIQYTRSNDGYVTLRGVLNVSALNTMAFRLPAGYRPLKSMRFVVSANQAFGQFLVGASGDCFLSSGALTVIDLSGIVFLAEQ
ncbi:hypothetical protein [Paenibacillus sp. EKM205P]|uniref:hypothetical protein n=1 Tax=Paenibacillus sp. EKM205P TaxID=1683673 RepID=UPI0013EDCD43|nr:hypothetical protein [Paenibacillus sp. EKM205P]KAF6591040.1 hypothetical protein G9G52_01295 [Paenibacillus sp. EKM205P]